MCFRVADLCASSQNRAEPVFTGDEGLIVSRYASFPSLALPVSGSLIVLFRQLMLPISHKTVAISCRVLNGFP